MLPGFAREEVTGGPCNFQSITVQIQENGALVSQARELYERITGKKFALIITLAAAAVVLFLVDVSVGPAWLSPGEVFRSIFAPGTVDDVTLFIVRDLRLPVALMAIVVGASLAAAGAEMQTILDNPLASPYTLGVSAAAGFGAALAIVVGAGVIPFGDTLLVPANAFCFSLLTSFLIFSIARFRQLNPETMVLAGIAVLFLFYSGMAVLEYFAAEEELQAIVFWMFGSLAKTTWAKLGVASLVFAVATPLLFKDAWKLTALRLGDEKARSLGINVEHLRLKVLVQVSILTGAAVAFVGTIGFIGLAGPHIARMLVGEDQRYFLPVSALCGILLLSAASILSKVIIPGVIFPIGIITSFIGVPFLLSLLLRARRRYW
jgi:iron complex transport system permease protein